MKTLLTILILVASLPAIALERVTAVVTITNVPSGNDSLTINGSVRTWTNAVSAASSQVLIGTNSASSATNLFTQCVRYGFSGPLYVQASGSNAVVFVGQIGQSLSISQVGTGAQIVYTTNTADAGIPVRVPMSIESASVRQRVASYLVQGISDDSTNAFPEGSVTMSNFFGLHANQAVSGSNTFTGENVFSNANQIFVGGTVYGATVSSDGGSQTNVLLVSPTLTNGVNYGAAFSSPGTNLGSQQFGTDALASGENSTAFGNGPTASGDNSLAVGYYAQSLGNGSLAVGMYSTATHQGAIAIGMYAGGSNFNSIAIGYGAYAGETNSTAIGAGASAAHENSIAIGKNSATTKANQIMLGTSAIDVTVNHDLTVGRNAEITGAITNATLTGGVNFRSDAAFQRYDLSTLANGANAAVTATTNVYVKVSGPTAAFSINGIAGGRDGRYLVVQNSTGYTMTVANDSGVDPTPANRIYTGTGADVSTTNTPGVATLIYDSSALRWVLISIR